MSKEDLLAMGFDPKDVDSAISNTNGSIEQCIDWISALQDGGEQAGATGTTASTETADPMSGLPLEERLRIRKEAAAKKRAELEKQQRIDRLEIGKRQAEADRARQEMQIEQAKKDAANRKREALDDRQYKEKLKKKIAQDRMERESRERERQRAKEASENAPGDQPAQTQTASTANLQDTKHVPAFVRLRVKYDAKTITKSIAPDITVEDLGEQLAPEFDLAPGSFELECTYPRSTIPIVANTKTVYEQGLSNASLIIKLI